MKYKIIIILFFSVIIPAFATNNLELKNGKFEVKVDSKKYNLFPTFDKNFYLANNFFISIFLDSSYFSKDSTISGFENSRLNKSYNQTIFELGLLNFEYKNLSVGFGENYYKIDKNEFGYIVINDNFTMFDSNIKYEIFRHFFSAGLKVNSKHYLFSIASKMYYPSTTYLKQKTYFKPLTSEIADYKSNLNIGINYKINSNFLLLLKKIYLGLALSYEYLPIKYDLKVLEKSGNNYIFVTENINQKQTMIRYGVYFVLPFLNNMPYIGFYKETLKIKEENTNNSSDTNYIVLGSLF